MAEYIIQEETLIDIADAIREKEGAEAGPLTITWDGDTTGKLTLAFGDALFCKVSDRVFTPEEVKNGTLKTSAEESIELAVLWDMLVSAGYVNDDFVAHEMFAFVFTPGVTVGALAFPETGVYFCKADLDGDDFHISEFTTTAASGGGEPIPVPDFAPRIKALSGGEQATPEITVDENGLIIATAGDKSATQQLPTQPGKTIVPGPTEQIAVAAGKYVTEDVKVAAASGGGGGSEFKSTTTLLAAETKCEEKVD